MFYYVPVYECGDFRLTVYLGVNMYKNHLITWVIYNCWWEHSPRKVKVYFQDILHHLLQTVLGQTDHNDYLCNYD